MTVLCQWCERPATGQIEIEPALVRKSRKDGVLVEIVVVQARHAYACDAHARVQRAPDPKTECARLRRQAREWATQQERLI